MAEQTVESLQIIVDANVKKAWTQLDALQKRLGQLQSQVNKRFAPKMDAMKSAMQSASAPMEQVAAEVKKSSNQIAKEQAKLQADLRVIEEKAQAQIATALLQEEAHRVRAQEVIGRQAEAQRRLAEVSSATANKMIQDQRDIEAAVSRATARMQEQANAVGYKQKTVPRTESKMATSTGDLEKYISGSMSKENFDANMQKMRDSATQMENAVKQAVGNVSASVNSIPTEEITAKMQQFNQTASSTMNNLNAQIEIAKQKLQALLAEYQAVAAKSGTSSPKAVGIESKVLSQQKQLQGLYAKVSAETKKVKDNTDKATASTKKYGDTAKKVLSDATSVFSKIGNVIKSALSGAMKMLSKFGNSVKSTTSKASGMFTKLGETIKRALIIGVLYKGFRELFSFISNGIKAAISAPEIENMFNVAFGSAAAAADEFAGKLKSAFGIDKMASKQMLATFQNFNVSMGIGQQTAAKMSKSLTQLAYDMASLYEADPQQVFENLQSGLQGMPRALYKYGISVTDANVKQTALTYGIIQQGQEMNEQQKIAARYITILNQTATSQGDLARTMQSPANQLRIFKSQMEAAGRAIGQAFMPFIQAVLPWINALAVVLERVGNALARFTFKLFGRDFDAEMKAKQDALKGLQDSAAGASGAEDELGNATEEAAKKAEGSLAPFDKLNLIQDKTKDNSGSNAGAGGGFEFPVPELPEPTGESPFEKMADQIQEAFKKVVDMFQPFLTNVGNSVKWVIDNVLKPLADWTVNEALPLFFEALAAVLNSPVWITVGTALQDLFYNFIQPLAVWSGDKILLFLQWVKDNGDLVAEIVVAIGAAFLGWKAILLLDKAAGIILAIGAAIKGITTGATIAKALPNISTLLLALKPVLAWISATALPAIGGALASIGTAIGGAVTAIAAFLGISVGWLVAIVAAVVAAVVAVIVYWDEIKAFFTTTLPEWWNGTVVPFFENMWSGLVEGVKEAVDKVKVGWDSFIEFFKNLPETIGFILGKAARAILDWGKSIWNFFTVELPKWWQEVIKYFEQIKEGIKLKISEAFAAIKQWGADVWNFITVEIPRWVSSIVQWLSELPSKIWDLLVLAYENVKQWGSDLIGWAETEIPKFVNDIVNFLKELPKKVWEIGKDVVESLWNGIKSMGNWLKDKIGGLIGGIVDGFMEGFEKGFNGSSSGSGRSSSYNSYNDGYSRQSLIHYTRTMPVPALAQGGVLRRSTLVNVAEYAGASSNPEIVAPQSMMYDTVVSATEASNNALIRKIDQLIKAVERNSIEIHPDIAGALKIVQRGANEYREMTGMPAF